MNNLRQFYAGMEKIGHKKENKVLENFNSINTFFIYLRKFHLSFKRLITIRNLSVKEIQEAQCIGLFFFLQKLPDQRED